MYFLWCSTFFRLTTQAWWMQTPNWWGIWHCCPSKHSLRVLLLKKVRKFAWFQTVLWDQSCMLYFLKWPSQVKGIWQINSSFLFPYSAKDTDIVEEAIYYFKANVFFKNYEIKVRRMTVHHAVLEPKKCLACLNMHS